jgi:hypothetical protein
MALNAVSHIQDSRDLPFSVMIGLSLSVKAVINFSFFLLQDSMKKVFCVNAK